MYISCDKSGSTEEKKSGSGYRERWIREVFTEMVTFEKRPEGGETESHRDIIWKRIPGRRNRRTLK